MKFKDEEGNKLFGYSQTDLNENTAETRRTRKALYFLAIIIMILGVATLIYLFYMTYYVIHNNVVNNIVSRCIR